MYINKMKKLDLITILDKETYANKNNYDNV